MTDYSGHQLNGVYGANVVLGGPVFTSEQNASAIFPGSPAGSDAASNSGTVIANPLFQPAQAVSIEAWVKTNDWNRTNSFLPIVSYGRDAQGQAWVIELTPQSGLQLYLKTNAGTGNYTLKPASAKISPGLVYHVVVTYDGANAKMYVNGNLDGTLPVTGTISYVGVHPQYGLAIGASLGGTRPIFNGAISNVSIYPTALSSTDVTNHFVKGQLLTYVSETPVSSDSFVDTIGVNTHITGSNTAYTNPWATFKSLIVGSGIRHIRDALQGSPTWYVQYINELAAAGIHSSLIGASTQQPQDITSALALFGNSVEAVEGLNEPDLLGSTPSAWVPPTRAYQQMLWSTVKGNAATANLHVVGPAVVWESDALALGDLSSSADRGNIHDYFSAYNPGTYGWGPLDQYGIYGSITFDKNVAKIISGPMNPIWATETGYKDVGSYSVDDRIQSRYVPRIFLENYLNGVNHTTIYAFYDDALNNPSSNYGLVTVNNVPKPSYYAIKSLTHTLADPGAPFTPSPLQYVLSGSISNVQHLLMQKRDGTYQLAIWVETQSWNPDTATEITVPQQAVSLQPKNLPASATITTIGDSGNATTSALTFSNGAANFSVDDHVTIVSFK